MILRITWTDGTVKNLFGTRREVWKQANRYQYRIAELFNRNGKKVGKWIHGMKVQE